MTDREAQHDWKLMAKGFWVFIAGGAIEALVIWALASWQFPEHYSLTWGQTYAALMCANVAWRSLQWRYRP